MKLLNQVLMPYTVSGPREFQPTTAICEHRRSDQNALNIASVSSLTSIPPHDHDHQHYYKLLQAKTVDIVLEELTT